LSSEFSRYRGFSNDLARLLSDAKYCGLLATSPTAAAACHLYHRCVRQAVSAVVERGSVTGREDAISPRVIQREVAIPILCEVIAHIQVKRTGLRKRRAYDGVGCCGNTVYINFPRLGGVI
jgi:hypothetical protein